MVSFICENNEMENDSLISSELVEAACAAAMQAAKEAVSYDTEKDVKADEVNIKTFNMIFNMIFRSGLQHSTTSRWSLTNSRRSPWQLPLPTHLTREKRDTSATYVHAPSSTRAF